jgi:hypothetical protein
MKCIISISVQLAFYVLSLPSITQNPPIPPNHMRLRLLLTNQHHLTPLSLPNINSSTSSSFIKLVSSNSGIISADCSCATVCQLSPIKDNFVLERKRIVIEDTIRRCKRRPAVTAMRPESWMGWSVCMISVVDVGALTSNCWSLGRKLASSLLLIFE